MNIVEANKMLMIMFIDSNLISKQERYFVFIESYSDSSPIIQLYWCELLENQIRGSIILLFQSRFAEHSLTVFIWIVFHSRTESLVSFEMAVTIWNHAFI